MNIIPHIPRYTLINGCYHLNYNYNYNSRISYNASDIIHEIDKNINSNNYTIEFEELEGYNPDMDSFKQILDEYCKNKSSPEFIMTYRVSRYEIVAFDIQYVIIRVYIKMVDADKLMKEKARIEEDAIKKAKIEEKFVKVYKNKSLCEIS